MGTRRCWCVGALCLLTVVATQAVAQDVQAGPEKTDAQIVRIRSLEGDVRVARGGVGDAEWEQAEADLPLATGFNLATGVGRAEIEFEDGSTVYLGENSALAFDELSTLGGVPRTQLNLLTGVATLHVQPALAGETFILKTPTDRITTTFPGRRYLRVNSYLDAIAMTPQVVAAGKTTAGETVFRNNGKVVEHDGPDDSKAFAAWDGWVAGRDALRTAELNAVVSASGLPASTPGLADMNRQGAFFPCAPYGTCWEPPAAEAGQDAQAPASVSGDGPEFEMVAAPAEATIHAGGRGKTTISAVGFHGFSDPIDVVATVPAGFTCVASCAGQISPGLALTMQFQAAASVAPGTYTVSFAATSGPLAHEFTFTIYVVEEDALPFEFGAASLPYFPCYPSGIHPGIIRTGRTGIRVGYGLRYGWAVCHTGTWIFRNHIYVWVLPKKGDNHRHHHPPCKWVKCGKGYCYVPVHPRDEPGKLPINSKHDVYRVGDKKGQEVERVAFDPKDKRELLTEAPKEFRRPEALPLIKTTAPVIGAREMKDAFSTKADADGAMLQFDRGTRRFVLAKEVAVGNRRETVTETFEEHHAAQQASDHHATQGGAHAPVGGAHATGGASRSSAPSHSGGGGASHSSAPSHSGASHASAPSHSSGGASHSASSTHHH
jgi:hypothetical protein